MQLLWEAEAASDEGKQVITMTVFITDWLCSPAFRNGKSGEGGDIWDRNYIDWFKFLGMCMHICGKGNVKSV